MAPILRCDTGYGQGLLETGCSSPLTMERESKGVHLFRSALVGLLHLLSQSENNSHSFYACIDLIHIFYVFIHMCVCLYIFA